MKITDRQNQVLRLAIRRVAFIPLATLVVVALSFGIVHLLPGDPVVLMAGDHLTNEDLDAIRADLGRDRPLPDQFLDYLTSLATGDLGQSYFGGQDVSAIILQRLPSSLELVGLGFLVAMVLGLMQGTLSAYYRRKLPDRAMRILVSVQQATPDFVFALTFIYIFFFLLGWAPSPSGRLGILETSPERVTGFLFLDALILGETDTFRSLVRHSILPALSLGVVWAAAVAKIHRGALNSALSSGHVEYGRALGIPEKRVVYGAFAASRTPVLTYSAIIMAGLVGGGVIVELIFNWNGFSQWGAEAIFTRDLPSIQAFVLITGAWTILVYVLLDLVVLVLDPRVTLS